MSTRTKLDPVERIEIMAEMIRVRDKKAHARILLNYELANLDKELNRLRMKLKRRPEEIPLPERVSRATIIQPEPPPARQTMTPEVYEKTVWELVNMAGMTEERARARMALTTDIVIPQV